MTGPDPDPGPDLELTIDAPVDLVVQIGRLVVRAPAPADPAETANPPPPEVAAVLAELDRGRPGVLVVGPDAPRIARAAAAARRGLPVVGVGPGSEDAARALARSGRPVLAVADVPAAGLVVDGWGLVRTGAVQPGVQVEAAPVAEGRRPPDAPPAAAQVDAVPGAAQAAAAPGGARPSAQVGHPPSGGVPDLAPGPAQPSASVSGLAPGPAGPASGTAASSSGPAGTPGTPALPGPDPVATCEAACAALHRVGDAEGEAAVRLELADLLLRAGSAPQALSHAARAAALLDRGGTATARAGAAVAVGEALAALGEADAALEQLERARRHLDEGPELARLHAARARAAAVLGDDPLPDLAEATELFARCAHRPGLLGALRRTAEAYLRRGDEAAALAVYRHALAFVADPRAALLLDLLDRRIVVAVERIEREPGPGADDPHAAGTAESPDSPDDARAVLCAVAELLPSGRAALASWPLLGGTEP